MTRILCIVILLVSLACALTQRKFGFGAFDLNFDIERVLNGQVWRVLTYPFVASSAWGLIINLVMLWLFGSWFEARWGERDFLRFFALASVGAAALAIPLSFVLDLVLPFRDVPFAEGPGPALDAMLVALALTNPDSTVLFGFVLPVRARSILFLWLGIQVVQGIMSGAATLSITLGGMIMGYLLVTGNWRPKRWFDLGRLWRGRRRRGLYVVPPRHRDHTLH